MTRIVYLGPTGTFTQQAVRRWAGESADDAVPAASVAAAVQALVEGEADEAVVPFENSVEGSVPATQQALLDGPEQLRLVGEIHVEVEFALLVRPGTALADVRTVATHPHAAAQTRGWTEATLPDAEVVPEASTARAAQLVAEGRYDAAIAAQGAAEAYGLEALVSGIADRRGAVTRFVVVRVDGTVPERTGADCTTLVAHLRDNHPGALRELLDQFSAQSVDLTRLESRPTGEALGEYCFWVDASAHLSEARMGEALVGLRRTCRDVRFLGSYPRADGRPSGAPDEATDAGYGLARAWVQALSPRGPATDPSRR